MVVNKTKRFQLNLNYDFHLGVKNLLLLKIYLYYIDKNTDIV